MRAILALSVLAAVAASGCASRDTMRALQAPAPAPQGMIRFETEHHYRDAIVVDWIGGISQRSYLFAEPNQRVIRPVVQDALIDTGLLASTNVRARYGLRILVTEAHGPSVGAEYDSEFVATYTLVDRQSGDQVWQREIRTPGVGAFLALNEYDWQAAWFLDPILAIYAVNLVNPVNYLPIASDSAADRARRQGLYGGEARAMNERFSRDRAARANYAAVETNVSAFLIAFAADNNVEMIPILPCYGTPEQEARKSEIMAAGGSYRTDDCRVQR
jgi:hypothetical protein